VRVREGPFRRCPTCAASWDRRARFCGTCGAPLLETADDPAARRGLQRWARRLGLAGAVLLVGFGTATLGDDLVGELLAHRPDPVVAMPDADELVEREPASSEERSEALAPFDPARASCSPRGCELWRRPAADWVESPTVGGGNLAFVEHEEVVAVDVQTGEELWRAPLPERPAGAASAAGTIGMALLGGDDHTVAVANQWGVRLLSRAGELRWDTDFETPKDNVAVMSVTDDVVVLAEEDPSTSVIIDEDEDEGSTIEVWLKRLTVLDARTGQLRWTSDPVHQVFTGISGDLLAVFDGEQVQWLDAQSGQTVSSLPTGDRAHQDAWVERVGDLYLVNRWLPDAVGRAWLLDGRDLAVLAELEGSIVASVEVADRVVLLLTRDSGLGPVEREAIAVGTDGTIRWRLPLESGSRHRCCANVIVLEGGLVRLDDGGVEPVVVEAATGVLQDRDPLAELPDGEEQELWPLRPGLFVQRTGAQTSVIHDHRGRQLTVHGTAWPVYLGAHVPPDTPILLMGDNELVAVRFPP
jgi:hypothetical protein